MEFEVTARAILMLTPEQAAKVRELALDYSMTIAEVLEDQSAGWWRDFEQCCDIEVDVDEDQ